MVLAGEVAPGFNDHLIYGRFIFRTEAHVKPSRMTLHASIIIVLAVRLAGAAADQGEFRVGVVVGTSAPQLEQYAADQLCYYLNKLFRIRTRPTAIIPTASEALFIIGSPTTNDAIKLATAQRSFPEVNDQGIVLRRAEIQKRPALIVGGGSPRSTLWAVYELVQRWGVTYLLHGDVLPENVGPFRMPDLNVVMEPALRVRSWRTIDDFASGPESWGMADFRPVLDQLAKLKFNRILISTWAWQPFLDLQVDGLKRRSACLWYCDHYPITSDMIGRELFGDAPEFWNPDLPLHSSYQALASAGEQLIHNLMGYSHQRGMDCMLMVDLSHFPPEFAPLLKDSQKGHGMQDITIVPGPKTSVDDTGLIKLRSAVLRTTVDTYPEADYLEIETAEFRQWIEGYKQAWNALDAKYGLEKDRTLDQLLDAARHRTSYPGGAERAVNEVKGDLMSLYSYDHLLNDLKVLHGTRHADIKFIYGELSEEMYPLLGRILPTGTETLNFIDYTPSRVVHRQEELGRLDCESIPCSLLYTLEDDNVGLVPQLTTDSLYTLTQDLVRDGWAGYSTRYWLPGGQDPNVAYFAKAAWQPQVTPDEVDRDQLHAVCGEACIDDMIAAFHAVESVTKNLEWNDLSFAFPVKGMMMRNWKAQPVPQYLVDVRAGYQQALDAAHRAEAKTKPLGKPYVDYWVGRLTFAVGYLKAVADLHSAAVAEAAGLRGEALEHTQAALLSARQALEAYAMVARDQSDRGAIAVMNEYVYRPLRAKVKELASSSPE